MGTLAWSAYYRGHDNTNNDSDLIFFVVVVLGLVRIGVVGLVGLVRWKRRPQTRIHSLPQVFPDLEERKPLLGDVYRLAGSRVPALVGLVLANGEAAEAADLDTLSAFQRLHHRVEDRVDDSLRLASRQLQRFRDFLDELGLGHP